MESTAQRKVTVIPAMVSQQKEESNENTAKRRVAAYARVSTDSDEQLTSYDAQVDYYSNLIKRRSDWTFAGMYSDEGISGIKTANRPGFKKMIKDAMDGKIDLIITKSISRFARNTVDMLSNVRELKDHGVEVYFEKENIYSMDTTGELMMTILASMAQEESRSISENTKWGIRRRFEDGKVIMPYKRFLGFEKGADGMPVVVEAEADIIRHIYRLFIQYGKTAHDIAKILTNEGYKTPGGKDKWMPSTVRSILTNEKYRGSALLQKTYIEDFLTKRSKINDGVIPQYYIEKSHQYIIEPEEWDEVQLEIERRKSVNGRYRSTSPFSGRLICSECGSIFGSKVWHSNDKYRTVIWQCNDKFNGSKVCTTPHLRDDHIKTLFNKAVAEFYSNSEEILSDLNESIKVLENSSVIDRIEQTDAEMEKCRTEIMDALSSGSNTDELYERFTQLEQEKANLIDKQQTLDIDISKMKRVIKNLERGKNIQAEFDERLFVATINKVLVYKDRLSFEFFDGRVIDEKF